MANEITITASISGYKSTVMTSAIARSITGLLRNMTGNFAIEGILSVATSATLIPMGGVTSPHYAWFYNLDSTNYLTIRNGSSGADVAQLYPGDMAIIPLLATGTFYALANTAACLLEYCVYSL